MVINVGAGEFKAKCLQLMDEVNEQGTEVLITKHGKPVARLVPVEARRTPADLYGSMKGWASVRSDLVTPAKFPR
jgi:prevent-host-death family protein